MSKLINVRLDEGTHRRVVRIAEARRVSKSQIVREALAEYANVQDTPRTAYEVWQDVIGIAEGLPGNLSERTGDHFTRALRREKRRKRKR
jgi:predicted transcriptional regulator